MMCLQWLQANGQWLVAMGTVGLAIATFAIVHQNRKQLEHNRLLVESRPIKELIISVINPIKESALRQEIYLETKDFFEYEYGGVRNRSGAREHLRTDEDAELFRIGTDAFLLPRAFSCIDMLSRNLDQTLYEDFRRRFNLLAGKIDAYNPQRLKELLLELLKGILSQSFRNKVKETAETSNSAYSAMQPCDSSWLEGKLRLLCARLVLNKLLLGETNFQQSSFRHYVGIIENEQMLRQFWSESGEALMAIIDANEDISRKASEVLQESDRLRLQLKRVEEQLSEEKDRLRLKYNFTKTEIQTPPEERCYSEYAEQNILA